MRKIIHVDMDAFFASVEIRDNPALHGKPVIVGGMPGTRGVVCTCSYEARKYGVHSAMSANRAFALCPKGIFLPPRREAYIAVSKQIRTIFHDYTDLVEPLSIDEAYLDVTENKRGIPYAVRTAREIRERIRKETGGLTASAGVSFNLFLAKTASDLRKPDGLTVILPEYAERFLDSLPIGRFYGIGPATEKNFHALNVKTGADLRKLSKEYLRDHFGKNGEFYYGIVRGIDPRSVTPVWERKSLGVEETFDADLTDQVQMYEILKRQSAEVAADLQKKGLAGHTVTLKIKFFDFRTITRSRSTADPVNSEADILNYARILLLDSDAGKIPVRLLGITVSKFHTEERVCSSPDGWFHPDLFENAREINRF